MSLQLWNQLLDRINYWINSKFNIHKQNNGRNSIQFILIDNQNEKNIISIEYDMDENQIVSYI